MDSLTHIVVGACLGELIAGKQLGKKAMLIGALANTIPDFDVIAGLWNSPSEQLLAHRGITHSILFAFILSPLLAWFFYLKDKQQKISYTRWLLLIGSGMLLHNVMDAFTAYGTGWLEPFYQTRISFNTIYILDPIFTLPVLIGAIVLWILKKTDHQKRKRTALIALSLTGIYLTTSIIIKLNVNTVIEKDLASKNISYESFMATPTPMNNLLWYGIVRQKKDYYIGYYSIFDKERFVFWELYTKNDSLLEPYKHSKELAELIRFSQNYYCMTHEDGDIKFNDMRFGQIGGWAQPQAPFVFNFDLKPQNHSQLSLQQGRFKSFNKKDLKILLDRIGGKQP